MIRQSETAKALAEQRRIIAVQRMHKVLELRLLPQVCSECGTEDRQIRVLEESPISRAAMICAVCFGPPDESDHRCFTDLPLVWQAIERTNE